MWGDQSLQYWSRKTIHSSALRSNYGDESSEEEVVQVSLGKEIHGHRSLDTIHSSSINSVGRESLGHRYQDTSYSVSINRGGRGRKSSLTSRSSSNNHAGYVYRSGSVSQETRHFSSCTQ